MFQALIYQFLGNSIKEATGPKRLIDLDMAVSYCFLLCPLVSRKAFPSTHSSSWTPSRPINFPPPISCFIPWALDSKLWGLSQHQGLTTNHAGTTRSMAVHTGRESKPTTQMIQLTWLKTSAQRAQEVNPLSLRQRALSCSFKAVFSWPESLCHNLMDTIIERWPTHTAYMYTFMETYIHSPETGLLTTGMQRWDPEALS